MPGESQCFGIANPTYDIDPSSCEMLEYVWQSFLMNELSFPGPPSSALGVLTLPLAKSEDRSLPELPSS